MSALPVLLLLLLLALLTMAAGQQYVEVEVSWDTPAAYTRANDRAIHEEIARRLCGVPFSQVATRAVRAQEALPSIGADGSSRHTSTGVYACYGMDASRMAATCSSQLRRDVFSKILEQRTRSEQQELSIVCRLADDAASI